MKQALSSYLTCVVLFAFFLLAFPANSEGYTLISNLGTPPYALQPTEGVHYIVSTDPYGTVSTSYTTVIQGFYTGPDPVTIQSVTIRMGYGGSGSSGFKLVLHGGDESASTIFGSPLTPITENGDHPALPGFYSFATPNLTLQANTYYTLEASAGGVGNTINDYQWSRTGSGAEYTNDGSGVGLDQLYFVQETVVIAEDGSDHVYVGGPTSVPGFEMQFSIDAVDAINAAPEPSRALLLLAGLSLLALTRRRTV
jgi:hypothetical protein